MILYHKFADWGLEVHVMAPPRLGICCNVRLQPRLELQWSLCTHQRAEPRRTSIASRGRAWAPRYGRELGHWLRLHVRVGQYKVPCVNATGIQYHYHIKSWEVIIIMILNSTIHQSISQTLCFIVSQLNTLNRSINCSNCTSAGSISDNKSVSGNASIFYNTSNTNFVHPSTHRSGRAIGLFWVPGLSYHLIGVCWMLLVRNL